MGWVNETWPVKGHGGMPGRPAGLSCEGLTDRDAKWMEHAACKGSDVNMFFPGTGEFPYTAMTLCARCEVRTECGDYAKNNGINHGVWGGESARTRRAPGVRQDPTFSHTVRARMVWLTERGWTLDEIARELGCHARTVARVLAKERSVS